MDWLAGFLFVILIAWAIERFYLRGRHPDDFPAPEEEGATGRFTSPKGGGPEHDAVVETVRTITKEIARATEKGDIQTVRAAVDSISDGRDFASSFSPIDAGGIPAEWVIAPGADDSRRVLYIHGGGFIMGSPKSHRSVTSKFSEITGCAVLAIDYRLLPEHKHMDCVEDCQIAYQWLLENGPAGPSAPRQLFFGGDSAGGNLALVLSAWVRDEGLRAPDAVVALSPLTDCTFTGASLRTNLASDVMLAHMLGPLIKLPRFAKSLWVVRTHRIRPASPVASPLLGDLSGLPPTLIQASESEMLLDDARRYVYKARASGSPATLQTWTDVVHVWQIFNPELPQANEAWTEIGKFIEARTLL